MKLFLPLMLFAIISHASAQTFVSGNISSNTVWTKANSPYQLAGTVGVPAAYTLTIEPGVVIQRFADYQIIINGSIIFNGTATDSISFVSGSTLNAGNTYFIEFQKSNLSNSSLRFIKFVNQAVYGSNNIRIGNEDQLNEASIKNSGKLTVSRSNISSGYTTTKGYKTTSGGISIDSSVMNLGGVTNNPYSEQINVSNSNVSNLFVLCIGYAYGVFFSYCNVKSCAFSTNCSSSTFDLYGCKVEDSQIGDGGHLTSNCTIIIYNSLLLNTPIENSSASVLLYSSKFIATKTLNSYNNPGVEISNLLNVGSMDMNTSDVKNLSSRSYNGIYASGNQYPNPNYPNARIVNSLFTNLQDAVNIKGFAQTDISGNNFKAISRYHIANYSTKDFTTTNNYYELKSGQNINDVIFDNNDNLNYGTVTYSPYATALNTASPISQPINVVKQSVNGGGVKVTWNKNTESNLRYYNVYSKKVSAFVYTFYQSSLDTFSIIPAANIGDSIAITAVNTNVQGYGYDITSGYESWYTLATSNGVLPLTLVNFSAAYINKNTVLTWQTKSEINVAHFDVEHSVDNTNFQKIGTVAANNLADQSYTFQQSNVSKGIHYYRLKMMDVDGKYTYSGIKSIVVKDDIVLNVFPNPATTEIVVSSNNPLPINAYIVNSIGQIQQQLVILPGNSQTKVDVHHFPVGMYFLKCIDSEGHVNNIRFIKD